MLILHYATHDTDFEMLRLTPDFEMLCLACDFKTFTQKKRVPK